MTAMFDTLRLVRTLRDKAKFSSEQAEGLADALAEAMQGDVATKADIQAVKADIQTVRADIQSVKTELRAEFQSETQSIRAELQSEAQSIRAELQSEIQSVKANVRETELRLKADIESTKAELIRWMFGTIGFQTVVILGAVIALAKSIAR